MFNLSVIKALEYLYKIVEASEKGYDVAAISVKNRAIKMLFKSHATRRAQFKSEISAEIQRLDGDTVRGGNLLGTIHRGRITIFAVMTIGEENAEQVVLKEVALGERMALYAYENALRQKLPADTRAIIQRQYEDVCQIVDKVRMMRGRNGERLIMRLYDTKEDGDKAVRRLKESGHAARTIKMYDPASMQAYASRGVRVVETVLAGAAGGFVWGTLTGLLAAGSILNDPQYFLDVGTALSPVWIAVAAGLGLIAAGMFIGGSIGFFIGTGIGNDDKYIYNEGIEHGQVVIEVSTDSSRASSAWHLLAQINVEARAGM